MVRKAIDLFAGPGGLSLGLSEAGFDIVAAIEWDADAGQTYRHNLGSHTYTRDITDFGPKELRKDLENKGLLKPGENLSLVAGGPPCPGFSLIGRSKIMDLIKKGEYGESKDFRHRFIDDPRNRLFLEFVKYVSEFKPDYFIMENVSGMSSFNLDGDPVISVIKSEFESIGYTVEEDILNAAQFGVPQQRKRIIFLGSRRDVSKCHLPKPTRADNHLSAMDAIDDLSDIDPNYDTGLVEYRADTSNSIGGRYRKMMRRGSKRGWKTCHWTRKVNPRDRVIFPFIKSGRDGERQIYGDIYPSKWDALVERFTEAGLKTDLEGNRHYISDPSSGKKWIMYPNRVFKDKMRRIEPNKPAPTVVAHLAKDGYMFIHPIHDRTITVREAARFQSFPDTFEFKGSMTSQFRQVGNAVPPLLALELGRQVRRVIDHNTKL